MNTAMDFDLDRLQQRWQAQDARLDEVLRINQRMLRALEQGQVGTALQGVWRMLLTQLVVDFVAVFALGVFIGNRLDPALTQLRFLVPAAVLLVAAIAVLLTCVHQLVRLSAIDPAGPVTEMQQRLEALRANRIRVAKVVILACMVMWIPLTIVGLQALFGFDVYAWLPRWMVWMELGVGAAMIPLALWASRRFGDRLLQYPAVKRVADDLAGRSMSEARAKLAELAAFGREDAR